MTSRSPQLRSRIAIVASGAIRGFLRPHLRKNLAFDEAFNPDSVLSDITAKNYKSMVPTIVERTKKATAMLLARDAAPDPQDLAALLSALGEDDEPAGVTPANPGHSDVDRTKVGNPASDDETHPLKSFLSERLGPADLAQACDLLDKAIVDGDPENIDESAAEELLNFLALRLNDADLQKASTMLVGTPSGDPAEDEPDTFPGKPNPGGTMDSRARVAKDEALRRKARVLAYDALARRDFAGRATFAKMFPSALPGRTLDAPAQARRQPPAMDSKAEAAQADFRKRFPVRVL